MNDLTVDTATLNSVASTYATIAGELGLAGTHLDATNAGLTAVFGVIGGDFAAAIQQSTHEHRDRIARLADAAHRIGAGVHDAAAAYRTTDHSAGSEISASGSGTRAA